MGATSIQWTDFTFNPWVGCQRVSPGCTNCYAEAYDKRVGGVPKARRDHYAALTSLGRALKPGEPLLRWGPTAPRARTSPANWRLPLKWHREARKADEDAVAGLRSPDGVRRRVFCASLADVFEDRPELEPWRVDLFNLIDDTPHLDWLLLTKRPENIWRLMPDPAIGKRIKLFDGHLARHNVWLGTTVEDQQRANERLPHLVAAPAVVRFLSCEPLLEAVDLSQWLDEDRNGFAHHIDWVIIGGESGGKARPFQTDWAISLINQCRDAGRGDTFPFLKQLGSNPRNAVGAKFMHLRDRAGGDMAEWPADLRVREFPEVRRG